MTANRRAKNSIRSRMAQTGEGYTEARRALLPPPAPPSGPDRAAPAGSQPPDDPIGWFTDQAYNTVVLAQDEARMLGRALVEPEHLLLALARYGNVQRLLRREGIVGSAIHAVILARIGSGGDLVLGRVPRSPDADAPLWRAIAESHRRGVGNPSTEYLLLGVAADDDARALLASLGLLDVEGLVDAAYPNRRPPLDPARVERSAEVARRRRPARPGPMAPVFERFTAPAHAVVAAAAGVAISSNTEMTTLHLLVATLGVEGGVAADVRARRADQFGALAGRADELVAELPRGGAGIPTEAARLLLAQDALVVANRLGVPALGTGHLLLALLACPDPQLAELRAGVVLEPGLERELEQAIPGEERLVVAWERDHHRR
jgi:ATP-dependent Clp protease ATP-binding subunit ClpA